jgi:hypothetical protein
VSPHKGEAASRSLSEGARLTDPAHSANAARLRWWRARATLPYCAEVFEIGLVFLLGALIESPIATIERALGATGHVDNDDAVNGDLTGLVVVRQRNFRLAGCVAHLISPAPQHGEHSEKKDLLRRASRVELVVPFDHEDHHEAYAFRWSTAARRDRARARTGAPRPATSPPRRALSCELTRRFDPEMVTPDLIVTHDACIADRYRVIEILESRVHGARSLTKGSTASRSFVVPRSGGAVHFAGGAGRQVLSRIVLSPRARSARRSHDPCASAVAVNGSTLGGARVTPQPVRRARLRTPASSARPPRG